MSTAEMPVPGMNPALVPESQVFAEIDDAAPYRINITSGLRDRDLIKSIPGATWDRNERIWHLRLSWAACVQLRAVFGDRLQIGARLNEWAYLQQTNRIQPCLALRGATDVEGWDDPDLYPLQKVGAMFIATARQAFLGDEVGSGKTRQVIKALELNQAYPAIVVATMAAKEAWREEYEKVAPHRKVVVVGGNATQRRKQLAEEADVYIVHWQLLRFHSRLAGYGYIKLTDEEKQDKELNYVARKCRAVIADESHRMQDPKAKQTRAMWAIGDELDKVHGPYAPMRVCMTGTPVTNAVDSAWAQLRFMSPLEYPSKTTFIERYALMSWNPFGFNQVAGLLPERKEEFFRFFDPRFIRRPFKVVVPWVPDPVHLPPRHVELKGKQGKAYKDFLKESIAETGNGDVVMATNPLEQLTRLKQMAMATLVATGENDPKTGKPTYRLSEPSAVLDELMDVLEELGDAQTLIFSESRQFCELALARVQKAGYNAAAIHGEVPETERTARRHAFQDGRIQHLCMTMGAAGESLTFTAATAEIFIERSFSLVRNKQAEGRAPRPGQEDQVRIIDILPVIVDTKGKEKPTVFGRVHEVVVEKGMNLEEIVRDRESLKHFLQED